MNYYDEIKKELINNEINRKVKNYSVNKSELDTYYNVGKMLSEAGKSYDDSIIKEYSRKLTNDLGKGYSQRNLRNMWQFYEISQKWQTTSAKLSWSHICELLPLENLDEIKYYVHITKTNKRVHN